MIFNKVFKTLFLFFLIIGVYKNANSETKDQRIKVNLRAIGHQFLLQIQDSTSRVLPIEFIDGRYKVSFEKNFSFEPDFLSFAVYKLYEGKNIKENFIVEVEECFTEVVVHSFEIGQIDVKTCKRRGLPEKCYNFYFTEVTTGPIPKMVEMKSEAKTESKFNIGLLLFIPIFLILGGAIYYFTKKTKPIPPVIEDHYISIGLYRFNKKNMKLEFEDSENDLSAKEADLLLLLNNHEDQILERDYILNQVWGDDGTYSGRTLDVFISKLRKKLENDSNLKIINVRSVGYRFVKEKEAS